MLQERLFFWSVISPVWNNERADVLFSLAFPQSFEREHPKEQALVRAYASSMSAGLQLWSFVVDGSQSKGC